jgi:hypothetical protein
VESRSSDLLSHHRRSASHKQDSALFVKGRRVPGRGTSSRLAFASHGKHLELLIRDVLRLPILSQATNAEIMSALQIVIREEISLKGGFCASRVSGVGCTSSACDDQ